MGGGCTKMASQSHNFAFCHPQNVEWEPTTGVWGYWVLSKTCINMQRKIYTSYERQWMRNCIVSETLIIQLKILPSASSLTSVYDDHVSSTFVDHWHCITTWSSGPELSPNNDYGEANKSSNGIYQWQWWHSSCSHGCNNRLKSVSYEIVGTGV